MTKAHWFAHSPDCVTEYHCYRFQWTSRRVIDCEYTVHPKKRFTLSFGFAWLNAWLSAEEHLTTVPTNEFAEANLFPLSHVLTWSTWQNLLLLKNTDKKGIGQLKKEANRHSLLFIHYTKISNVCKTADNKMVTTAIPDTKPTAPGTNGGNRLAI